MMEELIKIDYDKSEPTVSGRELHEFLGSKTAYKDWIKRMIEYGFIENEDFCSFLSESSGGRPTVNHNLTVDMAKEICMLARSERGKQARRYFIEVERRYKSGMTGEYNLTKIQRAVESIGTQLSLLTATEGREVANIAVQTKLRRTTVESLNSIAAKKNISKSTLIRMIIEKEVDWLDLNVK